MKPIVFITMVAALWGHLESKSLTVLDENACWYDTEPAFSFSSLLNDVGHFGRNIFSGDMVAVITPFIPPFGLSYMVDKPVHSHFYCHKHHKNIRTCSNDLLDFSEVLVAWSIGSLSACSFAVKNRRLQRTAQLYAFTLPLTLVARSIVKKIPWSGNLRPKHERYDSRKCYYGGFPSGHMLEMVYATVLFGLSMGPGFGVPLGLSTVVIASAFVQSNRHYISQLIAGAAIGTVFGFAGYWAISRAEDHRTFSCSVVADAQDKLALRAQYRF